MKFKGTCRCGAIEFRFSRPYGGSICHCLDCKEGNEEMEKKGAGEAFPYLATYYVRSPGFELTKGGDKLAFIYPPFGGSKRYYCKVCNATLFADAHYTFGQISIFSDEKDNQTICTPTLPPIPWHILTKYAKEGEIPDGEEVHEGAMFFPPHSCYKIGIMCTLIKDILLSKMNILSKPKGLEVCKPREKPQRPIQPAR
mmetsp:Transcript_11874/g.20007  ORF Transcript_11874/g.20007 Transcript_11874/m.20007 type:complete len:198 (-) Transcript_11874:188-781(-)|eukprot:CAMPEP_0119310950 /NCGR_PEP_ID=MMETSP1333-20130426/20965_1 /TAXON_ID=418940 /ORGANISM="Scyphosphaera apsteinii, Strain RCC1455" /LENGTH=197 /DNA_ID=CAMNT_0007315219 /DNA_START=19 /DNA_END=612 /DNA_ORIENTATION=-